MTEPRLALGRGEILAHRRMVGSLDERMPAGEASLRRAAWAGLQDSMPRAALLSIHARVEGTTPAALEEPSLVQVWGPRYSAYVIAAADRAVFTLGRLPDDGKARRRAEDMATRLDAFLDGRAMGDGEAGRGVGVTSERTPLRGAHRPDPDPLGRCSAADDLDRAAADDRSARRPPGTRAHGTSTCSGRARPEAFAEWAGVSPASRAHGIRGPRAVARARPGPHRRRLDPLLGRGDVPRPAAPRAPARFLPSGDTFFLLQGADRELLVPDADRRAMLWTPRVWPGAVLVEGEVVGTWRRAQAVVTVEPWRKFTAAQRDAIEAEAVSMPLPGLPGPMRVRWPL